MSALELLKKGKKVDQDTDQILDIAHELENITQDKVEALVIELLDADNFNAFKLGGALSVIKINGWFDGFKDYKEYVSKTFGLEYRKAQYWINIYEKLTHECIPWATVSGLGWTKIAILIPVITAENISEWVEKASAVNCDTLKAIVKAALSTGEEVDDEKITTEVSKLAFTVHLDQKETIKSALEKAKVEVNTEYDTVALENICLGYLGGSVTFNQAEASTGGGDLETVMQAAGFEAVLVAFEKLWPHINVTLEENTAAAVQP